MCIHYNIQKPLKPDVVGVMLIEAAIKDDVLGVQGILARGVDINYKLPIDHILPTIPTSNGKGWTALHR
jgi:hypothetical protein